MPWRFVPLLSVVWLLASVAVLGAVIVTYIGGTTVERPLMIARTLPRVCQPALSLLILSAGTAWFVREGKTPEISRRPLDEG